MSQVRAEAPASALTYRLFDSEEAVGEGGGKCPKRPAAFPARRLAGASGPTADHGGLWPAAFRV